jgi:hypothetical protein
MNKPAVLSTAVVAATAAFVLATPTAVSAQVPTGQDFGQHVAECAQTAGMDGAHNPGMHRGFAGWDGLPC